MWVVSALREVMSFVANVQLPLLSANPKETTAWRQGHKPYGLCAVQKKGTRRRNHGECL